MAGDEVCAPKEIPIENKDWLFDLNTSGLYLPQTVAAPASELFSVGVFPEYFGLRDTCEIYGTIILYDEDSPPYELYCVPSNDPETLTPQHNLLSLDMPAECLVSTSWSRISLKLMDKAADALIVHKDFYFHKLTDINKYNKVQQLADDSVFVTYAAFPAAVVAILEITLTKKNHSAPASLNLSGNIIARCGNTYAHKYPGILLLHTPSNHFIKELSNVPIELSRDVVVVPAYSFLRIDLHLSQPHLHQQEDIICRADFLAKHLAVKDVHIETKDFDVHFNVHWCHPYELANIAKQPFKCPKISTDLHVHDVNIGRAPSLCEPVYSLVEVYAVRIHHDTNSKLNICGAMTIRDNWSRFLLFDRNEPNSVEVFGNEETIPIHVRRRCFNMSEYLAMGLKLWDVKGQVVIEGEIYWNDRRVQNPMSWYDKHICSVIRGVHGYASVFYTIFSKAVQAEVKISFKCEGYPDVSHCLHGSVVARHSNGTYLTEYDMANYQSVLFRGNASDLKSGCTLPLLKSVVAVPIDAFLTVAVNLYASPLNHELPVEHLTFDFDFKVVPDIQQVQRVNHAIEVSVEWSNLHKIFSEERDLIRSNCEKIFS